MRTVLPTPIAKARIHFEYSDRQDKASHSRMNFPIRKKVATTFKGLSRRVTTTSEQQYEVYDIENQ